MINWGRGSIDCITLVSLYMVASVEVPLVNSRLLELKLPVHRVNFDPSCDQGYGSERSPEEEVAPPLPSGDPFIVNVHEQVVDAVGQSNSDQYDFITKGERNELEESCFIVGL